MPFSFESLVNNTFTSGYLLSLLHHLYGIGENDDVVGLIEAGDVEDVQVLLLLVVVSGSYDLTLGLLQELVFGSDVVRLHVEGNHRIRGFAYQLTGFGLYVESHDLSAVLDPKQVVLVSSLLVDHLEELYVAYHAIGRHKPMDLLQPLLVVEGIQMVLVDHPDIRVLVLEPQQPHPVEVKGHSVLVELDLFLVSVVVLHALLQVADVDGRKRLEVVLLLHLLLQLDSDNTVVMLVRQGERPLAVLLVRLVVGIVHYLPGVGADQVLSLVALTTHIANRNVDAVSGLRVADGPDQLRSRVLKIRICPLLNIIRCQTTHGRAIHRSVQTQIEGCDWVRESGFEEAHEFE